MLAIGPERSQKLTMAQQNQNDPRGLALGFDGVWRCGLGRLRSDVAGPSAYYHVWLSMLYLWCWTSETAASEDLAIACWVLIVCLWRKRHLYSISGLCSIVGLVAVPRTAYWMIHRKSSKSWPRLGTWGSFTSMFISQLFPTSMDPSREISSSRTWLMSSFLISLSAFCKAFGFVPELFIALHHLRNEVVVGRLPTAALCIVYINPLWDSRAPLSKMSTKIVDTYSEIRISRTSKLL